MVDRWFSKANRPLNFQLKVNDLSYYKDLNNDIKIITQHKSNK
jgi:hypothetical protein